MSDQLRFEKIDNGAVRIIGAQPKSAFGSFRADPAMLFDALEEWLNANGVYNPEMISAARTAPRVLTLERGTLSTDPKPKDWREPRADDELGEIVTQEGEWQRSMS